MGVSAAALDHERDDRLRDEVGTLHVRLEEAFQVRGRALEERLRGEDTRVVHQHVDAAEALACGGRQRACGRRVADVARHGEDPRRVAEAPAGALELVGVGAVDGEAGPAGQERASHVEADTASGSGDDHAVDAIGHVKISFRFHRYRRRSEQENGMWSWTPYPWILYRQA